MKKINWKRNWNPIINKVESNNDNNKLTDDAHATFLDLALDSVEPSNTLSEIIETFCMGLP